MLRGINSESVDLIYLDPPFNKKKVFTAPIGTTAEGASFKDIFREEDVKKAWIALIKKDYPKIYSLLKGVEIFGGKYNWCYLTYMAIRLIECHRVLKRTGNLYLHCDPIMSHYLKLLLDCIFEERNFRNEVVWWYKDPSGGSKRNFRKKHDILFFYSKTDDYFFNVDAVRLPYAENTLKQERSKTTSFGRIVKTNPLGKLPDDVFEIAIINSQAKERVGYPTQKPIALIERIINASSNKGDTVLDPFCGCATTCVASGRVESRCVFCAYVVGD